MTARTFARHRPRSGTWTTISPYTANRVVVESAVEHGNKVRVLVAGNGEMEVDAHHKVEKVRQ